ncbi:Mut7-C RNAse domain-containing protein [Teredinibacter sp. KSP-S5-2]|uniref:Mut7-C RNAse domain-containing protein n=1 Tax=Teredinibacter sp. KSP-S5-2 TaxID=3034506 RepID=UPI0029350C76|nr:Mut7-C RNAse domain-containing protein [Teredinibacter sp. KSP-S5-2]WNO10872.1 Mut7-C RNAse domain-containing protein [Teredinibacter sp. KSP-S5-2]
MPFYISQNTLKQQVKLVVKNWPFAEIKSHQARILLCKLYGFENQHDYLKKTHETPSSLTPINEQTVINAYLQWVKRLAKLGSINEIQAKNLLHILWPTYLAPHKHLKEKLYTCKFKFHGTCLDFLNQATEDKWVDYKFDDRPSVKDAIEAIGVPHPEVGGITIDGTDVDFNYLLEDAREVEVYPHPYETGLLPYKPERKSTFLLDVHLAKLTRYLRMAGFDCLHESKDIGDELLAHLSQTNDYILLTRDIGLLKRGNVKHARWIRNTEPQAQFKEIVDYYDLLDKFKPFSRCVKCNGDIQPINKESIKPAVPGQIFESQESFKQCAHCNQVYWKGSHYDKIKNILLQAE